MNQGLEQKEETIQPHESQIRLSALRTIAWTLGVLAAIGACWLVAALTTEFMGLVLYCSVLLGIWLLAYGANRLPEVLLVLIGMALFITFLFALVAEEAQSLIGSALFFVPPLISIVRRGSCKRPRPLTFIAPISLLVLGLVVTSIPLARQIEILSWGFDSYNHLGIFLAFHEVGTYFWLDESLNSRVMSWVPAYPSGHWALWNSLTQSFDVGTLSNSVSLGVSTYMFLTFATVTALFAVTVVAIVRLANSVSSRIFSSAGLLTLITLTFAFIGFGNFSHLLWSGFPSLILGITAVIAFFAVSASSNSGTAFRVVMVVLASVIVAFVYPLLLPAVGSIALGVIANSFRGITRKSRQSLRLWIPLLILFASVILIFVLRTAGQFRENLLAAGGIEPISNPTLIVMLVLTFWMVWIHVRYRNWGLAWAIGTYGTFTWIVAGYSLSEVGLITYYPMRMLYLLELMVFVAVVATLFLKDAIPEKLASVFLTVGFIGTSLYAGFQPSIYRDPPMGATPSVIGSLIDSETNFGVCGQLIIDSVATAEVFADSIPLVIVSDGQGSQYLTASWPNSLLGNMNDDLWLLASNVRSPEGLFRGVEAIREWRKQTGRKDEILLMAPAPLIEELNKTLMDGDMVRSFALECPSTQGELVLDSVRFEPLPASKEAWNQESALITNIQSTSRGLSVSVVSASSAYPNVRTKLNVKPNSEVSVSGGVEVLSGISAMPYVALVWFDDNGEIISEVNSASNQILAVADGQTSFSITGRGPSESTGVELVLLGGTNETDLGQEIEFSELRMLVSSFVE